MSRAPMPRMRVRLVRKLADELDGIDVSTLLQGDVLELPVADAQLLVAEQWAVPVPVSAPQRIRRADDRRSRSGDEPRAVANNKAPRRRKPYPEPILRQK